MKLFTFFKNKALIYIDVITISLFIVFLLLELPRFILSLLIFRIGHYIKNTEYGKSRLLTFNKDRETIEGHWTKDKDLIYLTRVSRGFYLLGFLNIYYFLFIVYSLKLDPLEALEKAPENVSYFLWLGLLSILIGLFLTFLGETHIIFFRNTPVKEQLLQQCVNCLRYGAVLIGVSTPILEVASNTPLVHPNVVTNTYQTTVPWGRGYKYNTSFQMIQHQALKDFSKYDLKELIDPTTNCYSSEKERIFVKKHAIAIKEELPAAQCNALGLKKGRFY